MALDVVANPTLVKKTDLGVTHWAVTGYEADASTAIAIKAAVTGKSHYITHVIICCVDDDAAPRLQDEDDNLLFGPVAGVAAGGPVINHHFERPIKMVAAKALEVKAAAAGIFSVYVEGYTK